MDLRQTLIGCLTAGVAVRVGEVFADYVIERSLGAGGMGAVFLARHPRLQRFVALKVLHNTFAADLKARAAFDREAAIAARLDHPNIVPVYDRSSPDDPALWLSMKFIEGGDTNGLLATARAGLAPDLALRLIADAAEALDFAHRLGVLHRDVKPANLLVEYDPRRDVERAVLTDFGIARTLDDTLTQSGLTASFAYTAPERLGSGPVDHRCDIYSLGCTLFQLLTGEVPFPHRDQAAMIASHLMDAPPSPRRLRPELPGALDAVIATALAKAPDDRYRTCAELVDNAVRALTAAQSEVVPSTPAIAIPSASATAPSDVTTAPLTDLSAGRPRFTRRRMLMVGLGAVPLTAGGVVAAIAVARNSTTGGGLSITDAGTISVGGSSQAAAFSPDGKILAVSAAQTSIVLFDPDTRKPLGERLLGYPDDSPANALAFSPDGTLLATNGGLEEVVRFWDMRTRRPSEPTLTGDIGPLTPLAFSPDGVLLASAHIARPYTVRVWNVAARRTVGQPLAGHTTSIHALTFSPDGTSLASCSGDRTIRLWDMRTWQPIGEPLVGHTGEVLTLVHSPDGRLLASGGSDRSVRLWDARTRQPFGEPLTGHTGNVTAVAFSPDGKLLASGSADRTVRVCDVRTRQLVGQPLTGFGKDVSTVTFNHDGSLLAATREDGPVHLWKIATAS